MRVSQIVLVVLLAVLAVVVHSQEVNPLELQHLLIKRETECMDVCLASVSSSQGKCRDACSRLVEEDSIEIAQTLADNAMPLDIEALADQSPEQRQNDATANLWELYYDKFSQMFASKGYSAGLQILPNAIELTDIRSDIPGAEYMDNFAITQARAQDYDDSAVLARELIQVTKTGKFREPTGIRIVDEFKNYLTGFEGVSQIEIPNGLSAESARRTQEYEDAIMACTENYFASASSWFFLRMYELDAFMKQFCPRVGQTEQAMYAQIGVEAARVNNNPAFAAAVALGRAQLYTDYSAFVKRHTIRTMELECIKAQNEGRAARGTARSFSFYHDYSSYKYKGESKTKSMSIGLGFISVGKASANMKMTGFDAASISGVDIAFEDYKYIPLHPGQWFSSMALRDLRFTRRNPHSPIGRYLGDNGSLSLIPRGLFVAVNPTVAFHMDSSQKESLKSASQKSFSIGLNIFGFSFGLGMGKGSSIDEGEGNGGKSRIAFVSRTCRPQLFAVDHYYFY